MLMNKEKPTYEQLSSRLTIKDHHSGANEKGHDGRVNKDGAFAPGLRERELLEGVVENIPVMLVMWDPNLEQFMLNRFTQDLLGWTNEDANESDFLAIVYPKAKLREEVKAFMHSLTGEWKEFPVTTKDGRQLPTAWSNVRLTDETMIGIGIDLSERKSAEEALRENEQRLRLAAQAANFGMYDANLETKELYWSEEMFSILGLPDGAGKSVPGIVPEFIHPDDVESVSRMMAEAYDPSGNGKVEHEHRIIRPDGQARRVLVKGQVEFGEVDGHRRAVRSVGILLDITERKQAEERIHDIARFPAENPFPVLRLQKDGTISYSNPPGRVLLKHWECEVSQKAPSKWRQLVLQALKTRQCLVEELVCGKRNFSFAITPLPEEGYVNIYGQDITRRKHAQEALEHINKNLEQRVEERTGELKETIDELNQTKSSLLQAHRIARLGNWHWDFTDGSFWCSNEVYHILGVESAKFCLSYENFMASVHPDDVDLVRQSVNRVLQQNENIAIEHRIIRPDGSERVVRERAEVMHDAVGKPVRVLGTIQDVTDEKARVDRLRQQDKELRSQAALLDLAHDTIFVHDLDGRIIFWNKGAEKTYGWKKEDVLGEVIYDLLKTRFSEPLMKTIAVVSSLGRWDGELVHQTKNGELITVESRWALQKDEKGNPLAILEIDRDITERELARKQAEEARHYSESIIETIEEAILVLDEELQIISANKAFYETFHLCPDTVIGRFVYNLSEKHWQAPRFRQLLEDILPRYKTVVNYEIEYAGKKGTINLLLNAREIFENPQDKRRILLAFHDVTRHKQQEQALKELTEELLQAEEHQRQQVATALHDSVGQMLAFSKRELARLLKKPDMRTSDNIEKILNSISQSIKQSRALTSDLSSPTLQTFGLKAAFEELAENFAEDHGFSCRFEINDEPLMLTGKVESLLYRSMKELLCNIAKHAQADNVVIHSSRTDNYFELTVSDDGKGFDTSCLKANGSKNNCFGLFSIQQRLTNIGGSFTIESKENDGTVVSIRVPVDKTKKH